MTADMQPLQAGWQQNGTGLHSQDPGPIHLLLAPSMQDLMQYPAYPACRVSLICDFFGLEHCGTWWEGPVGTKDWPLPS